VRRAHSAPLRLLGPLLGLLLLTFGLRVAGLETQSIWVDEGFSIDFSTRTASDMTAMWKARGGSSEITDPSSIRAANDPLAIAVDIHPPLYYLTLHEWMPLAGKGEYAVRFPSVIVGTLLALVLFKIGQQLGSPSSGLAAGGLGAVTPFYVAYSQEARMYAPVALFSALSLYFCFVILRRRGPVTGRWPALWPWTGLVLTSSLALYTHYSAVLVIAAENLIVAGVLGLRLRRSWGRVKIPESPDARLLLCWAGSQAIELLLFFPWLRTTIGQVANYNKNLWVPNWQHELSATLMAFDAGMWIPQSRVLWLSLAASVVLVAGLAAALIGPKALPRSGNAASPSAWGTPRSVLFFALGAFLAEMAIALLVFQIRPEFHPRYLLVLATPYYLLFGVALAALWRLRWPLGLLSGAVLAAACVLGLAGYELDPNFSKDDTRTLAQYLSGKTSAEDVVFMDAPEPLGYYYHGPAKLDYVAGDEDTVGREMTRLAAGKKRVVFVQWYLSTSDPEQLVPFLLQKYGRLVDDHTFRGYRERTYALPGDTTFELSPTPLASGADFDRTFQLESAGYGPSIAAEPGLLGRLGQPVAASGEKLMIALRWKLLQAVTKDYKVSGYLTDAHGNLGGQVDLLLRHDQATTTHWVPGEEATDYYVLETRPGLMPGSYTINVAVYPDGEQERLSVLDAAGAPAGGSLALGTVDVLPPLTAPDAGSLAIPKPLNAAVAPGVSLIGYDLPSSRVSQGGALRLTLFWQASAQPPDGLETSLKLTPAGQPAGAAAGWSWSAAPAFPSGQWRPGYAFRDWYQPLLPADLAPGAYELSAGMGQQLVPLGQVQVLELQRSFDLPAPSHPLSAAVGSSIELLGYDVDRKIYAPGSTVQLTVYWRGVSPMADAYTVFAHLLDGGRHVVSQVDLTPGQGQLPTTSWLPGQVVRDVYELPLKPDLPSGSYQLEVGFYRPDTGARLKATSALVQSIDDGLLIGRVTVAK